MPLFELCTDDFEYSIKNDSLMISSCCFLQINSYIKNLLTYLGRRLFGINYSKMLLCLLPKKPFLENYNRDYAGRNGSISYVKNRSEKQKVISANFRKPLRVMRTINGEVKHIHYIAIKEFRITSCLRQKSCYLTMRMVKNYPINNRVNDIS